MKRLIALLLAGLLLANPALAAVTANSVVTAQTPNRGLVQFLNASTPGTYATAYTGGSNGSKIVGIWASTNDQTATHAITCGIFNGGTQYWSWTATTTLSASSTTYSNVNLLTSVGNGGVAPQDSDGNPFIYLASASDTIQCTFGTTITSGQKLDVGIIASDF